MKMLLTLLQMSLLDINNSNVSVILSVFLLECKSHKHFVFFFFPLQCLVCLLMEKVLRKFLVSKASYCQSPDPSGMWGTAWL